MGLRLVAHYFERIEALIVSATLDAAGIPNWVHAYQLICVQPFYTFPLGGYRVLVVEDDLGDAVSVLHEARANPLTDGERFESGGNFVDRVMSLLLGWLAGGAPAPIRWSRWIDQPSNDSAMVRNGESSG